MSENLNDVLGPADSTEKTSDQNKADSTSTLQQEAQSLRLQGSPADVLPGTSKLSLPEVHIQHDDWKNMMPGAGDSQYLPEHQEKMTEEDKRNLERLLMEDSSPFKEVNEPKEKATKQLENNDLFKLLPEEDRKALEKVQTAILDGDTKGLQEAMKHFHGDPERLKEFAHAIEKNLHDAGAHVNLDVTKDGKLLVYNVPGTKALEVGEDGKPVVRAIETEPDGSVHVLEGKTTLRPSADELAKNIAKEAVGDMEIPKVPHFEAKLPDPDWQKDDPWRPGLKTWETPNPFAPLPKGTSDKVDETPEELKNPETKDKYIKVGNEYIGPGGKSYVSVPVGGTWHLVPDDGKLY